MSNNELDDPFALPTDPQNDLPTTDYSDDFHDQGFDTPVENQGFVPQEDHFPEEPAGQVFESEAMEAPLGANQSAATPADQASAQPKPFLKTPLGMVICGVAALGIVGVGVTAYSVANPPGDDVAETSGEFTPPPTNHEPAPEADFGAGQQEPVVAAEAREVVKQTPAAPAKTAAQLLNLTEVKTTEVAPAEVQPAPVQMIPEPVATAREDELKKQIAEQQQTTEELQKNNASLTQALSKLSKVVEKSREDQILLSEQVSELKEKLKPAAQPVVAQATSPTQAPAGTSDAPVAAATASANPLTEGRTRIPGLQVVNTTSNGDMSIVKKVSNGRVFTMFKGETIGTVRGNFKITAVLEKGSLLLLGDKYYIDTVAEEWSSAKASPAAQQKPEPKVEAKKPAPKREVQPKSKPVSAAQCNKYTLNAVYDAGKSFGIVSSSGDFNSYKVGDNMPGIGAVKGLNAAGNLNVGDCTIESVY